MPGLLHSYGMMEVGDEVAGESRRAWEPGHAGRARTEGRRGGLSATFSI